MLEFEQLKQDIDTLPEDDQQLVREFVAMLKQRHDRSTDRSKAPQIQPLDLDNEPFVGMWCDRPEMQDSAAWVKQVRHHHWSR